jgi:hypothetical protein
MASAILPKQGDPKAQDCGICESRKKRNKHSLLECPHCDHACDVTFGESCPICRSGMKGLPEREGI